MGINKINKIMKFIVALIAAVSAQCVDDADGDGFEDADGTTPCPLPECVDDADGDGFEDADGTTACAAPAAADDADDDGGLGAACETAEDCGEGEICASGDLVSSDEEHADFDADELAIYEALFPLNVCMSQEDCDAEAASIEEDNADAAYEFSMSCGATKLVASFAALALASAM